jgi:predicted peptidase
MVAALKAAGGNVRYTEYPGVKHNSWDNAYGEPELFTWLLAQKLSPVK